MDKKAILEYLDWKVLPQNNPWNHSGSAWHIAEVSREFQLDRSEVRIIVEEWMPDGMKTKRELERKQEGEMP